MSKPVRHIELDRNGAGQHAAHQHLKAGDVIRWAAPAASCPVPPRRSWVADALAISARVRSACAPLGVPVVPDVDTTRATSSSISSPTRNAVVSSSDFGGSRHPAPAAPAVSRPSSTPSRAGSIDRADGPAGTTSARRVAIRASPFLARRCGDRRCRARRRAASPWRPTARAPARRPRAPATRRSSG